MSKSKRKKSPDFKAIIWNFFVEKIGKRNTLSAFVVLTIIFILLKYLPEVIDSYNKIDHSFQQKFPKKPKFDPTEYTIGFLLLNEDSTENTLIESLKKEFYTFEGIDFYKINSIKVDFEKNCQNNCDLEEEKISQWIDDTGAKGAIWGKVSIINNQKYYVLNWTKPSIHDFYGYGYSTFFNKKTLKFPYSNYSQIKSLLNAFIIGMTKQFNNAYDKPKKTTPSLNLFDKEVLESITDDICWGVNFREYDCNLLHDIRLELFLLDEYSNNYFDKDGENIGDYIDLSRVTGNYITSPSYPKVESDIESYFLTINYIWSKAKLESGNEYFEYFKNWTNVPQYRLGLEVERKCSFCYDYINLAHTQAIAIECLNEKLWESETSNKSKNRTEVINNALKDLEDITIRLSQSKQITDFQKGILLNRLGVLLIDTSLNEKLKIDSFVKAQSYFNSAIQKMNWFKFRMPLYYINCKINYARSVDFDLNSEKDVKLLLSAKRHLEDAIQRSIIIKSYSSEELGRQVLASIYSKLAVATGKNYFHCLAIEEWSNSSRVNPVVKFDITNDTTFEAILKRFYSNSEEDDFENCLIENYYDPNQIYSDSIIIRK